MELRLDGLFGVSQTAAWLILVSLAVILVLLITVIVSRVRRNDEWTSMAPKSRIDCSTDMGTDIASEVIAIERAATDPEDRAKRFEGLATSALEAGRLGEAKELFQKCLAVAEDNGIMDVLAHARYELGNLAKAHNDLTLACENWQLARALYDELGEKRKVRELDTIMADAQCPSDWVLNKF